MRARELLPAAVLVVAAPALAHRQAGLACLAAPAPAAGGVVPTNVLVFDFAAPILQGPRGPIPTVPAPPPWDFDARYRVAASPLLPNTTYQILLQFAGGPQVASFTTGAAPDTKPPSAPKVLAAYDAPDPADFTYCMADRVELIAIAPSTDDTADPASLRYSVSAPAPDGGLTPVYAELTPVVLGDGGTALVLPVGIAGLPGSYVVQARDEAGNLSAPGRPTAVDVGPTCDFSESTAGRAAPPDVLTLLLLVLGVMTLRVRALW